MTTKNTQGRLSKSEWLFIEENAERLTAEEIARELKRDLDPVLKYLRKIGKSLNKKADFEVQAEYDLKSREYYTELQKQFSKEELELFMYHWKQIVAQFERNILPTEELQVLDVIKIELIMNRSLVDEREAILKIHELNEELSTQLLIPLHEQDREFVLSLERQINGYKAARTQLARDYKELQSKKDQILKTLKATREQRVEKIDNNKMTFASLVHKLVAEPEFVREQNKKMEKMRLAMEVERNKLGSYHTFADGSVDRCLINEDTVFFEDEDLDE